MLKFLRKYQLILLAVGGSLLMVAFLLQPVLNQITPDQNKRAVAMIDGQKITLGEQILANNELDVLRGFLPDLPFVLGLAGSEDETAHWILLKHEAERLGVMGVQQDGADWIQEIAFTLAQRQLQQFRQSGQQVTPEQAAQFPGQVLQELERRQLSLMRNRRVDKASFNRVLSTARGVVRLQRLYDGSVQLSRQRAIDVFVNGGTAVLTDQLVLGPELLEGEVAEPTEAEIAAHFEKYKSTLPGNLDTDEGGNVYGFGYRLSPRVKLEWLTLDRLRVAEVVKADPVAVRRRWQRDNPDGGDFATDRAGIEITLRDEKVTQIMTDADEVIRGEILSQTRGFEKEGIYRVLPDDWAGVDYEKIAEKVVAAIQEREGIRIPLPTVIRRTDSWQTGSEISLLPGIGASAYRVGNQTIRPFELPALVRGMSRDARLPVQIGMPIIDPPSSDGNKSRFYVTVLDARKESPPDSVDEISDRVASDLKSLRAFDLHESQLNAYREAAVAGGLGATASLFEDTGGTASVRVRDNIFVTRDRLAQTQYISTPDMRADVEEFRTAVLDAASDLDPLAEPDSLSGEDSIVAVSLPGSRSVALARISAKRPPSAEEFRRYQLRAVQEEVQDMITQAEAGDNPLAFAAMAERLGYKALGGSGDKDS